MRFSMVLLALAAAFVLGVKASDRDPQPLLVAADVPVCVTVRNGPVKRATRPVFHPNLSELS